MFFFTLAVLIFIFMTCVFNKTKRYSANNNIQFSFWIDTQNVNFESDENNNTNHLSYIIWCWYNSLWSYMYMYYICTHNILIRNLMNSQQDMIILSTFKMCIIIISYDNFIGKLRWFFRSIAQVNLNPIWFMTTLLCIKILIL